MVLYQFDFTVVAFPFGFSFLSLELFCLWSFFWIDAIDLIDSTGKKSRKYYIQVLTFFGTHQEGEIDEKPINQSIQTV